MKFNNIIHPITIIVPTKNEAKTLPRLIKDLSRQKLKLNKKEILSVELIIADADSDDQTKKIAKQAGVKIVKGGHPNYGRNRGVKAARSPIVYLMDADIRLGKSFLVKSYKQFRKYDYDMAIPGSKPYWLGKETDLQRFVFKRIYDVVNLLIKIFHKSKMPVAIGTCMLFKREIYLKINGFNDKIYCHGDTEIAQRLVNKGYRLGFLNNVYIRDSIRKPLKQGIFRYYLNSIKIALHRLFFGEIKSKKGYQDLTGVRDYFDK